MEKYNLTDLDVTNYILTHSNEDFPMNRTLDDFYKLVKEWCDLNAKYNKQD